MEEKLGEGENLEMKKIEEGLYEEEPGKATRNHLNIWGYTRKEGGRSGRQNWQMWIVGKVRGRKT